MFLDPKELYAIRIRALELANQPGLDSRRVLENARQFEAYLIGGVAKKDGDEEMDLPSR